MKAATEGDPTALAFEIARLRMLDCLRELERQREAARRAAERVTALEAALAMAESRRAELEGVLALRGHRLVSRVDDYFARHPRIAGAVAATMRRVFPTRR
ncbi:MAG TPA: hypothetical protein VEC19_10690 [Usitatibacter sp.]|nr:hypothetical protein [Usitatibacter sp.]